MSSIFRIFIRLMLLIFSVFIIMSIVLSPSFAPEHKLLASFLSTIAITLIFFFTSHPTNQFPNKFTLILSAIVIFSCLAPIWLLYSVVDVTWQTFNTHPLSIFMMLITYGLPIVLVWLIVDVAKIQRSPEVAKNLTISVASVVMIFVVLEIGLSLTNSVDKDIPSKKKVYMLESEQKSSIPGVRPELIPNTVWGHQYSSNERGYFDENNTVWYEINSSGYRDDEFSIERQPDTIRIALLGDSFGFGFGVWIEDTGASIMEQLLAEQLGCTVEIYNFSIGGNSTVDEAATLEDVALNYNPDMVVVWYFLNDPEIDGTIAFLGENDSTSVFPLMRSKSNLVSFLAKSVDNLLNTNDMINTYNTIYLTDDPLWQDAKKALAKMAVLTTEKNIPIVIFVHPVLFRLSTSYPFADIHNTILQFAGSIGFQTFDLLPAFEGHSGEELWVHASDQHPNEIAHNITAHYAAGKLADLLVGQCDTTAK